MSRILVGIILILITSRGIPVPSLAQEPTDSKGNVKSGTKTKLDLNAQEARRLNVVRVKAFADRAFGFQDLKLKTLTLSQLADVLWVDDEAYARQLFVKALDLSSPKDDTVLKEAKLTARGLATIHRQVIGYISKRDANWAKRLIESEAFAKERDSFSTSQVNIETAYDLARNDEPKSAIDFAERSLKTGVSPWIVGVLLELRRKDEALANDLFLKVVQQIASESSMDPGTLLYVGTYIFTSPKVDPADPTAGAQIGIGGVLVYDITADRPNIPPQLVRAYLQAATSALTRPYTHPEQLALYYVTDYLILAKTQRFAPDLSPLISAAMQALAGDIPRELLEGKTYKSLAENAAPSLEESLVEIDKISSQDGRDERYLGLTASLWLKKECTKARSVASRVSDADLRSRLNSLIDFRDAELALEASDIPKAESIAQKIPLSLERAVLWLGIARANSQLKRSQAAIDSLNRAVETARRIDDARSAFVFLNAAGQMVTLNSALAVALFEEAINSMNGQEVGAIRSIVWTQKVEKGRAVRVFALTIKGIKYGYQDAFLNLTNFDSEVATAAVNHFTREDPCAQSMIAVAKALLK